MSNDSSPHFSGVPSSQPPTYQAQSQTPGQSSYFQQPGYGPPPIQPGPNPPASNSGLAIASLVLGILACLGSFTPLLNIGAILLGIIAVVLGLIGLKKPATKGKSIAGIILGSVAVLISIAIFALIGAAANGAANKTDAAPAIPPLTSVPAESPEVDDPPESSSFTVPNMVGMNLQEAQDLLQSLGSHSLNQVDALGKDRSQIIDSNWKVCSQNPPAGDELAVTQEVTLQSVKNTESCPGEEARIGDTLKLDDVAFKVTAVKKMTSYKSWGKTVKGNWIRVSIKVTNNGSNELTMGASNLTLIDPDGNEYSYDSDVVLFDDNSFALLEDINPKLSTSGNIWFKVPKGDTTWQLQCSTGLFGSQGIIVLKK
jgi:hypothetical protein